MTATPWDALLHSTRRVNFNRCQDEPIGPKPTSLAGQVRDLLRRDGPQNAESICMTVDIPSTGLVWPVLKNDLAKGLIRFVNGKYELNPGFDEQLQREISKAVALLKRQGYAVEKLP